MQLVRYLRERRRAVQLLEQVPLPAFFNQTNPTLVTEMMEVHRFA
jgi:hypothetical protein